MLERVEKLLTQLKQISPMPADDDDGALTVERLDAYAAIVEELKEILKEYKDPRAIVPLVESFGYGEGYEVYWHALIALEQFDTEQLLPHLIHAVQYGERGSRKWAAYLLGICRDERAIQYLLGLLDDPEEYVRANAVTALQMIGAPSTKQAIERLQNDPSDEVRSAVELALAALEH